MTSNDQRTMREKIDAITAILEGETQKKKEVKKLAKKVKQRLEIVDSELAKNKERCRFERCRERSNRSGYCDHHEKIKRDEYMAKKEGQTFLRSDGFMGIYKDGKQQLLHRVVMSEKLKRPLARNEQVAFLDGDKTNCDPENLILRLPTGEITCPHCNETFRLTSS